MTMADRVDAREEVTTARLVAEGAGWRVLDVICRACPRDRPFEEQHRWASISAVIGGDFVYRSSEGLELMTPGSFLLGNAGSCFSCGHEHSQGDRCVSFQFEPGLFEEVAASVPRLRRMGFPVHKMAAGQATAPLAVAAARLARSPGSTDSDRAEETALRLASAVLHRLSDAAPARLSEKDVAKVVPVLQWMEARHAEPLALSDMAAKAELSRYHFLRCFRKATGSTPYHYLLGRRLRAAAEALQDTDTSVTDIAFAAGFGDLSEFSRRFRRLFGCSPSEFRKGRAAAFIGRRLS